MKTSSDILNPEYYTNRPIEPANVVNQYFRDDAFMAFAFQYIFRAGMKEANTFVQDCEKSIWWLKQCIANPYTNTQCTINTLDVNRIRNMSFEHNQKLGQAFHNMCLAYDKDHEYVECCVLAVRCIQAAIEACSI